MKQKIIVITFLFILLGAGCKFGDTVLGKWNSVVVQNDLFGINQNHDYIEFRSDGTYFQDYLLSGKWKRLDDNRLEIQINAIENVYRGGTRIVTVKIEGNILTMTETDGKSTKFKR